jgi:hypothetical protein
MQNIRSLVVVRNQEAAAGGNIFHLSFLIFHLPLKRRQQYASSLGAGQVFFADWNRIRNCSAMTNEK